MGIDELLAERSGIMLDVGCGANKQKGFVGMDARDLPGVDIVHNWNDYPWPLPDGCVLTAVASHVVEHVNPADGGFLRWMDELWRVMREGGEVAISCPHGLSQGFRQDPTHCNAMDEATFAYFDPENASGLWNIYQPRPWSVKHLFWNPLGNIECVLVKRGDNGNAG